MEKNKTCSKCKNEKGLAEFYKLSTSKDGFGNICKTCAKLQVKEWREKNPEKRSAQTKRYRARYPEKIKDYLNEWYQQNSEKVYENTKKWRDKNPENKRISDKKYRARYPEKIKTKLKQYREQNSDKKKVQDKKYRDCNREIIAERIRKNEEKHISLISDFYAKKLLSRHCNLKPTEIPHELAELKREQLRLTRLIKEMSND